MFASVFILCVCFFFNDTATTEIYTLSLHDALPISAVASWPAGDGVAAGGCTFGAAAEGSGLSDEDRKSTRLNSSHPSISYAVFCLKKKNDNIQRCCCSDAHRLQKDGHVTL